MDARCGTADRFGSDFVDRAGAFATVPIMNRPGMF
jgi:hypothetical protein